MKPTDAASPKRDLILVARLLRPHGVRGEIKAIPETDRAARLAKLDAVYVGETAGTAKRYGLASLRSMPSKQGLTLLVALDGVSTPDDALALRGLGVWADAAALPLEDGEYFLHDVVGLAVFTEAGEPVGTVRDLVDLPAHPVFVIGREGKSDVLVPDVEAFVAGIDFESRRLTIRPIEGLIEPDDADEA